MFMEVGLQRTFAAAAVAATLPGEDHLPAGNAPRAVQLGAVGEDLDVAKSVLAGGRLHNGAGGEHTQRKMARGRWETTGWSAPGVDRPGPRRYI